MEALSSSNGYHLELRDARQGVRDVTTRAVNNWIGIVRITDTAGTLIDNLIIVVSGTEHPPASEWLRRAASEARECLLVILHPGTPPRATDRTEIAARLRSDASLARNLDTWLSTLVSPRQG